MDNLVTCKRCNSDACYEQEVSPTIKLYYCYGCGFQANTAMTENSEFLEEQLLTLPDLYKDLMGIDEDGTVWMPSATNIPDKGMIFADGTSGENWKWAAVKATRIQEEEKEKFKKKDGTYYEFKMNMETLCHFEERDYIGALDYIGVFEK